MARFARAPSRPSAVLPRSAAAPRGRSPLGGHRPCPFRCRSTGETSDWSLWISPPACWGSGTKCRGGAVRRTAGKLQGVSWLASLAPPPGLRPYSPVSLPLHGGEVLWGVIVRAPLSLPLHGGDVRLASLDFSPSLLGEWHEVPRGRGPQDRWETPGSLMAGFARPSAPAPAV